MEAVRNVADRVKNLAVSKGEQVVDAVPTKHAPTTGPPAPQRQDQPGVEAEMKPAPEYIKQTYRGADKLKGKVALITGGDSGIGRAVAVHFAREGAQGIAIVFRSEEEEVDAKETVKLVEAEGARCLALRGDVGDFKACEAAVAETVKQLGRLDVLVNNAGEQHMQKSIEDITPEQLHRTFATNVFAQFYLTKAALPHLKPGSSIINTTSVTAYVGMPELIDYSSSKGCIVSFTRSLAQHLMDKGIRVNAVAPGPVWTSLIPATVPKTKQPHFHTGETPMKRPGQPSELAPCYVLLASEDGSYMSGQVLHPNGGLPVSS